MLAVAVCSLRWAGGCVPRGGLLGDVGGVTAGAGAQVPGRGALQVRGRRPAVPLHPPCVRPRCCTPSPVDGWPLSDWWGRACCALWLVAGGVHAGGRLKGLIVGCDANTGAVLFNHLNAFSRWTRRADPPRSDALPVVLVHVQLDDGAASWMDVKLLPQMLGRTATVTLLDRITEETCGTDAVHGMVSVRPRLLSRRQDLARLVVRHGMATVRPRPQEPGGAAGGVTSVMHDRWRRQDDDYLAALKSEQDLAKECGVGRWSTPADDTDNTSASASLPRRAASALWRGVRRLLQRS